MNGYGVVVAMVAALVVGTLGTTEARGEAEARQEFVAAREHRIHELRSAELNRVDHNDGYVATAAVWDEWRAEQKRIAEEAARKAEEERRAAEEAARAAEVQRQQASYSAPAPAAPAPGGGSSGVTHVEYVAGWGNQSTIDSCIGSVIYNDYGGRGIAEHWRCGGASFPMWAGATVQLTGAINGVYRVTGILAYLDINVHTVADLPGGFFYQTCINGSNSNMAFVGLERIG
jgi:hypothetical protein